MNLTIAAIILIGTFLLLIAIGGNIAYALGMAAIACALYLHFPLMTVVNLILVKFGNFSLLAVPFFILAGELMGSGGISDRLIKLSKALIGWMRGGLSMVNILASTFFGGISGSAAADTASLGAILIPMMEKEGYDREFATSITMTSSVQGILIPPSHNLVIYAVAAGGVSIAELFMAGLVPGLILGLVLAVYCYFVAVKRHYPKGDRFRVRAVLHELKGSIWALGTIIIVVGGVVAGICTATEAAAIAVVYSFIVTFFVYRDIPLKEFPNILKRSVKTMSTVLILTSCATAFSFFITYLQIPQKLTAGLLAISSNKFILLLIINAILLLLGCFMNTVSIILIMTPILLPVVESLGMSGVQFGVMMILNLGIGLITPPVGNILFIGSSVSGLPIERLSRSVLPQLGVMVVCLLLVTYIPFISMGLPTLIYG